MVIVAINPFDPSISIENHIYCKPQQENHYTRYSISNYNSTALKIKPDLDGLL